MPHLFTASYLLEHDWPLVTKAAWAKYPNTYSTHVTAVDVISREILPEDTLVTTRLLRIQQIPSSVPALLQRFMPDLATTFAVETTWVNAARQEWRSVARNLSGTDFLICEETCDYVAQSPSRYSRSSAGGRTARDR